MCIREYVQNNQNKEQFELFVSTKLGYGRWDAAYWFVGPEEGGGADCLEITTRVAQWQGEAALEFPVLNDLQSYCARIGVNRFHGRRPRKQSTWYSLIKLLGGPDGARPQWMPVPAQDDPLHENDDWIRRFQRDFLARANVAVEGHDVALFDISPLASPGEKLWLWACVQGTLVDNAATYASRNDFLGREVAPGQSYARQRVDLILQHLETAKSVF